MMLPSMSRAFIGFFTMTTRKTTLFQISGHTSSDYFVASFPQIYLICMLSFPGKTSEVLIFDTSDDDPTHNETNFLSCLYHRS